MKSLDKEKRFCGNCTNHNPYDYPSRIFCSKLYAQNKEPIADTLWCCSDWKIDNQSCYCIRDALKNLSDE